VQQTVFRRLYRHHMNNSHEKVKLGKKSRVGNGARGYKVTCAARPKLHRNSPHYNIVVHHHIDDSKDQVSRLNDH